MDTVHLTKFGHRVLVAIAVHVEVRSQRSNHRVRLCSVQEGLRIDEPSRRC